jgi:hypothetical protein
MEEPGAAGLSAAHAWADALIASSDLAGTNTRRVRRALAALFGRTVGKDTVSWTWRKVKSDWDAWNSRSLAGEPIVRLILDGTVVRVRLDRKATSISLLVVLGVREDGQKVLLAIKSMGGESAEAWRTVLDGLIHRGLRRPEFLIVDHPSRDLGTMASGRLRRYWRWKSQRRGGRPQIDAGPRGLIRQMSMENLLWGAPRIHDELLKLGFELAQSSVAKFMVKRRRSKSGMADLSAKPRAGHRRHGFVRGPDHRL